jgi:hypothetical protein
MLHGRLLWEGVGWVRVYWCASVFVCVCTRARARARVRVFVLRVCVWGAWSAGMLVWGVARVWGLGIEWVASMDTCCDTKEAKAKGNRVPGKVIFTTGSPGVPKTG